MDQLIHNTQHHYHMHRHQVSVCQLVSYSSKTILTLITFIDLMLQSIFVLNLTPALLSIFSIEYPIHILIFEFPHIIIFDFFLKTKFFTQNFISIRVCCSWTSLYTCCSSCIRSCSRLVFSWCVAKDEGVFHFHLYNSFHKSTQIEVI